MSFADEILGEKARAKGKADVLSHVPVGKENALRARDIWFDMTDAGIITSGRGAEKTHLL